MAVASRAAGRAGAAGSSERKGSTFPEGPCERTNGPVHEWFGLTYASFLVWHRAHLQSMPLGWQRRFVALAEELDAGYPDHTALAYEVTTVRESYVEDLTEAEMRQLGISASDDEDEDDAPREYYRDGGQALSGHDRVGIPVPDRVPHYRHAYLSPDEEAIAALRASRASGTRPRALRAFGIGSGAAAAWRWRPLVLIVARAALRIAAGKPGGPAVPCTGSLPRHHFFFGPGRAGP